MSGTDISKHHVLIAEYTLGLLGPHDTTRAHRLLSESSEAVAAALDWEDGLLGLTDVLSALDPSPALLHRIQTTLGHDTAPAPSSLYRKPAAPASSQEHTSPAPSAPIPIRSPRHEQAAQRREPSLGQTASGGASPTAASAPGTSASAPPSTPDTPTSPASSSTASIMRATPASAIADGRQHTARGTPAAHAATDATRQVGTETDTATAARRRGPSSAQPYRHTVAGKPHHDAAEAAAPPSSSSAPESIPITPPSSPRQPAGAPQSLAGNVWMWRAATVVFAGIALVLALIPSQPTQPPITIVKVAPTHAAILQAPGQTSTPGWVVTFDQQGNALMEPRVRSDIPADASVQLWTRNASMPQARSLGLVDPNLPVTVPASLMGPLGVDQLFEMTLEPEGGSPDASPSGPVLFIGQVVTFGAPAPGSQNDAADKQGSVR